MLNRIFNRPVAAAAIDSFDYVIVGSGIVGLAIAKRLSEQFGSNRSIVLLEAENSFGHGTSSRNSEVIHAGIYYPPQSEKAALCIEGRRLLYEYVAERDIPHARLGKLIVAQEQQRDALEVLASNAEASGVDNLRFLDRAMLNRIEPAINGSAALFSPSSGIIDSHATMQSFLHDAERHGLHFAHSTQLEAAIPQRNGFLLSTIISDTRSKSAYALRARLLINCAGLSAVPLAHQIAEEQAALKPSIPELAYSKGSYFDYRGQNPFKHLIYPMPDTRADALGIHATLDLAGRLKFGPDAEPIDPQDCAWNFTVDTAKAEHFAQAIAHYFPTIRPELLQASYAGIRPKLKGANGQPSDFVIRREHEHNLPGLINLFGIESPGLTACLAIANRVEKLVKDFEES